MRRSRFLQCCVLMAFSFPCVATLPQMIPAPQKMEWASGIETWISMESVDSVAAAVAVPAPDAALARLEKKLGRDLPRRADAFLRLVSGALDGDIPARTRKEAYRLTVLPEGIVIAAETAHGLHNGLTSLHALIDVEKGIPCVSVTDWPEQELRGVYAGNIASAEERFEQFVALKLNLLLLEDGHLYDLDDPAHCARFQRLAEQCRANFIEFVPELQSLGWGHFVLMHEPRAVEAHYVARAPFPVRDGRVHSPDRPIPPPPGLENPSFESGMDGWTAHTHDQHWRNSTADEASVVAFDGAAGDHALQTALTEMGTVRVSQQVTVEPHARYEARCRIRTQDVNGTSGAYIEVYGIANNGASVLIGSHAGAVQGTCDWQVSRVVFDTGVHQAARPGGSLSEEATQYPPEGFSQICVYVRLQDSTGTAWFDTVEIQPLQSPNALSNVVISDAAKVLVENATGDMEYEEGMDYILEAPELRYPYEPGPPLGVIIPKNSRIKEGDTLLLSFNQATHEDITCCPSEPLYDAFMRRAIKAVVDRLNPKYLHIGHDEPRFFNRDQRCAARGLSNSALFVDAIRRIHQAAKDADPQLRIMMWDDAINPYQNGPHLDTSDAAAELPSDIIVNIWWYDTFDMENQLDKSVDFFMNLGFSVTGSPWFRGPNALQWAALFHAHREQPQALGIIYTSWELVPDPWGALELTAEHCWSFGKPAPAL